MRVTDPKATKVVTHPDFPEARFTVWIGMTREERSALTREAAMLQAKPGEMEDLEKAHKFYEKIVRKALKDFEGLNDFDDSPLTMPVTDELLRKFKEVRVPGFDNLTSWLGVRTLEAVTLGDEEKKTSEASLSTASTERSTGS